MPTLHRRIGGSSAAERLRGVDTVCVELSRLFGRRALLAAGLAAPLVAVPAGVGAALSIPRQAGPPRPKPLGTIRLADRRPTGSPGEAALLTFWVRPAGNVDDAVFRYWRDSCWFPIPRTEVPLGPLAASGAVEVPIEIGIPAEAQLLTWRRITFRGQPWWRATLRSDGTLRNGRCVPVGVPDTGPATAPGGVARIGVAIACEIVDRGPSRRRSQFRFVLTIAAPAPG